MSSRHAELPNRDGMTRNLLIDLTDRPQVRGRARLRRASRYELRRRFGRGVVVRRRITTKGWLAKTGGTALIAAGLGLFLLGFLTNISLAGGAPVALMLAGGQAMILGTCLYCYQQLLIRSMHNEEALRFQYDIGYEAGHREADKKTVLIDLDAHRPCPCGSGKAQRAVVNAGDRV